jgi:hypothetical protein
MYCTKFTASRPRKKSYCHCYNKRSYLPNGKDNPVNTTVFYYENGVCFNKTLHVLNRGAHQRA